MSRRSSIARQMVAMVLIGIDLALIRTWVTPALVHPTGSRRVIAAPSARFLGELGPMASLALIGIAVAVGAEGRLARFGAGMALAGLFASLFFFLAPDSVRHMVYQQIVIRIQHGGRARASLVTARGLSDETALMMFEDVAGKHSWPGFVRCPFFMPSSQVYLGLILSPFAMLGGAFLAVFREDPSAIEAEDPPPEGNTSADLS